VSFESEVEEPANPGETEEVRVRKETSRYHFISPIPKDRELRWTLVDDSLVVGVDIINVLDKLAERTRRG
jgi:hypothetical protein